VLLLKVMLVLHIALVLQHLESGSQNEGGGVHNAGNQIKVALLHLLFFMYLVVCNVVFYFYSLLLLGLSTIVLLSIAPHIT